MKMTMKLARLLILGWALFLCVPFAQAKCAVINFVTKSAIHSNYVFTSTFTVTFSPLDPGDICEARNFGQNYVSNFVYDKSGNPVQGIGVNNSYSLTKLTISKANGFLTSSPTCWFINSTSNFAQSTVNLPINNPADPWSVAFVNCLTNNTTASYDVIYEWTTTTINDVAVQYCPLITTKQLDQNGNVAFFTGPLACAVGLPRIPTCTLKVPSSVTMPTVKPVPTAGTTIGTTKTEIPIQLLNCSNATGASKTPRITFSDSTGRTSSCLLQNQAAAGLAASAEIALFSDTNLTNSICLNNTLTNNFSFTSIADGATVVSQSKSIWVALTSNAANTVGTVKSSLIVKLDYL